MIDVRCKKCGRLLLKATNLSNSQLEIKCPKCSYLNNFWAERKQEEKIPKEMSEVNVIYR